MLLSKTSGEKSLSVSTTPAERASPLHLFMARKPWRGGPAPDHSFLISHRSLPVLRLIRISLFEHRPMAMSAIGQISLNRLTIATMNRIII